jgi:hypothetical protein
MGLITTHLKSEMGAPLLCVWFKGKKVEGNKITQPNERTWTNDSLNSLIGLRNFLSSSFFPSNQTKVLAMTHDSDIINTI